MENGGPSLDEESSNQQAAAPQNLGDFCEMNIEQCIQDLAHASQCKDAHCPQLNCQKMKRVMFHTKHCERRIKGGCPICRELIAVCTHHAKLCQVNTCPMPFCPQIKERIQQEQL